jgi:hypothetical protein
LTQTNHRSFPRLSFSIMRKMLARMICKQILRNLEVKCLFFACTGPHIVPMSFGRHMCARIFKHKGHQVHKVLLKVFLRDLPWHRPPGQVCVLRV